MLKPDTIPHQEPQIRVGIVLPDDKFTSLKIRIPKNDSFRLCDDHSSSPTSGKQLIFQFDHDQILCKDARSSAWRLEPQHSQQMRANCGLKVKGVIAGRGFHWQKPIDVHLPGSVEIRTYRGHLILINELPLEQYLMCVATSEMGARCPNALIEAQTIAARSWMLANIEQKHVELTMDVCNDDCCQRYQGSGNLTTHSIKGALRTRGQVLQYEDKICDARYSKSCGGVMETYQTIWGGQGHSYFQNIADAPDTFQHRALPLNSESKLRQWIDDTPDTFCSSKTIRESKLKQYLGNVDVRGKYFRWQVFYSQKGLTELLSEKCAIDARAVVGFSDLQRGGSGRLSGIKIHYLDKNEQRHTYCINQEFNIRRIFHKGFLFSSCFYIESDQQDNQIPDSFTLHGAGWGHGVGLCQIGALGMAINGYHTEQILSHYYPGTYLKQIYD